ncbi:MAG TPA: outer membrane protein assembly factor BamD, partial [Thermoanaerobaculia bacterium]|nr:outer membrane protein assembly factor BamD [Thermoanaerobaculia bacterium]
SGGSLNFLKKMTIAVAMLAAIAACHRGPRRIRPVVDPQLLQMSKDQVWAAAEEFYARHKWQRARSYYTYLYENHPNEVLGRRSLLRIADTFYEQGDPVNLVEAQYKYRDFINRYPTSDQADYAMLRIAMCSFQQMERPDRDQQKTKEALEKFNDMIRTYGNSPLKAEAEARRQDVLDRLGKHEHIIARFYMKRGSYTAAVQRLNYLIDTYPNFKERDGAFFDLGTSLAALGRNGEARLYFERVLTEYPQSDYADRARRRLGDTKA